MSEPHTPSRVPQSSDEIALVIVTGFGVRWGLPSSAVVSAHPPSDWPGPPPLEWEEVVGASVAVDNDKSRIFLLQTESAQLAVHVRGTIEIATVAESDVLPLPLHLLGREVAATRGICFAAGATPLLVMNVNRIGHSR